MRKRIVSFLLVLLACVSLTVPAMADVGDGGQFTTAYMYLENGVNRIPMNESSSGNGWTYDAGTHTLTLNGYHGTLMLNKAGGTVTLNLADGNTNTVSTGSVTDNAFATSLIEGNLVVQGGGTMIVEGCASISGPVIVKSGTLQINGGDQYGGLFLNGGSSDYEAALRVEGGSVTVKNGISSQVPSSGSAPVKVTGGELILGTKEGQVLELNAKGSGTGLENVSAVDQSGNPLTLKKVGNYYGYYNASGTPAAYAKITAKGTAPVQPETPAAPAFSDVSADAYYAAPVAWAVAGGITTGTTATTFSPNSTCTRAQIITFLYRAAGSPEPKGSGAFSDVDSSAYYAKAAQWAAEQGMADGTSFAPNAPCTRMMAVEFMWKQAGSPAADAAAFTDVSSPAVDWAVSAGVTTGVTAASFAPDNTCTRAQIVTFLYRAFAD